MRRSATTTARPSAPCALVQDVTARKRLEEQLLQAQKLESIGVLAGGVAHDFNNLLVGIVGNASLAELLLAPDSPVLEILRGIVQSGERCAHLTRQMLAYAGKGAFILEKVDVSAAVGEAGELLQGSLPKKIQVHSRLDPALPAVEADPNQIQQVFMSLALNAAEAIGGSSGAIVVNTGQVEVDAAYIGRALARWPIEPGPCVYLEVGDSGCGMDPEVRERIFDPFYSTKFQGRGLGLAAVSGIVRSLKGGIEVNTVPGEGSVFRVLLPAAPAGAPAPAPAFEDGSLRGGGAILVIDDEQVICDLARRALEMQGYEVLLADCGAAAIEAVREHGARIQLAILDIGMPGMSGEEVLPELRKIKPDLSVIVSSGYSEQEARGLFRGASVTAFIQKPYTVRALASRVRAALEAGGPGPASDTMET